jgi:phage shock protein A
MEIENTLKKMGIVLEKLAEKIDELDKRVARIEEKLGEKEKKFSSEDLKANPQMQQPQMKASSSTGSGPYLLFFTRSL